MPMSLHDFQEEQPVNTILVEQPDEVVVHCVVCGQDETLSLASFGVHEHTKRQDYIERAERLHLYSIHGQGYNPFTDRPYRR